MRLWAFWDQAKLITQVQELRKRQSPLYAKYVLDNHKKLFSAALRHFGSWEKALLAAGIEIPKYAHGSRLGILRALDDAVHGYPKKDVSQSLKLPAVFYFGSLKKATTAATRERTGSPKYRVTRTLARMHRRKQPLVYAEARHDNLPLLRAAEKQFGSWGKALDAAGIDPNLYYVRRQWREQKPTSKRSANLWQHI